MTKKEVKVKKQKPVIKMDPQHNSFVYANERILEKDKHKNPLGHRFISKTIKTGICCICYFCHPFTICGNYNAAQTCHSESFH